jgi:uncharacterized protein with ATP-grasp and redox domains
MKAHLDCVPCFLRQALQAARFVTDNEKKQEEVLRAALDVLRECSFYSTPPEIAHKVHFTVTEILGADDPYYNVKRESNAAILEMYDSLNRDISTSNNPVDTAIRLAIAGNIMDYGPHRSFDVHKTLSKIKTMKFAVDHTKQLKQTLERAHTIGYITDNAGEIVFDRLLIETINRTYNVEKWHVFVKGRPIINDATVEDADQAGLTRVNNVTIEPVELSKEYDARTDPHFLEKLESFDVVISKGQGNYEALSTAKAPIYFLLMAKCSIVAEDIGVNIGDIVVVQKFKNL